MRRPYQSLTATTKFDNLCFICASQRPGAHTLQRDGYRYQNATWANSRMDPSCILFLLPAVVPLPCHPKSPKPDSRRQVKDKRRHTFSTLTFLESGTRLLGRTSRLFLQLRTGRVRAATQVPSATEEATFSLCFLRNNSSASELSP